MPQIPTVTAPDQVAIPQANPGVTPASALVRTGAQMEETADYGVQVADRIRSAQNQLARLSAENQITAAYQKYTEELAKHTDPDQMPDPEAWKNELKTKFANDPKYADPRVSRQVEPQIDAIGEAARHMTTMRQLTLQKDQALDNLELLRQTVTYEMAQAPDDTMRGLARGRFEQEVHDAARHGWITPKQGDVFLHNLDATAEEVEIVNAIDKENPGSIQAMIDKTENSPERFKDIDPKRFAELKKQLRNTYEVAKDKQDRIDVSGKGDVMLDQLHNDITLKDPETKEFDPIAAADKIQKDDSIPIKLKKYLYTELSEEAGVQKKLQNERDTKLLDHLDPQVESGQLTFKELARRENLPVGSQDWLPRYVADHLMTKAAQIQRANRVESMQERSLLRQQRIDKSADLRDELLGQPGYLTSQTELTPYRLKGLTAGDANIVWKAKDVKGDPAWGLSVKMIQTSPAFQPDSKVEMTTDQKAQMSTFLVNFARTVENKNLTGQQITDELQKELKPLEEQNTKSKVQGWLGSLWNAMKENTEKAAGVEPKKTEPAKTYTPGGTPATRKQYFDVLKQDNPTLTDAQINEYLDKKGVK